MPWAARAPNPHLLDWLDGSPVEVSGRKVLVVGCGLGDDAEAVAARGAMVTAFDIAASAIAAARQRFPGQPVNSLTWSLICCSRPFLWRPGRTGLTWLSRSARCRCCPGLPGAGR